MQEGPAGLRGTIEYSTDLFEAPTIERMAVHYVRLLEAAASDPTLRLSELAGFDEAERTRLESWNETRADEPRACVQELVGEQARQTPAAPALDCGGASLSYEQLDRKSVV